MLKKSLLLTSFLVLTGCYEQNNSITSQPPNQPLEPSIIVIGHRGASALRPEHTLAAYQKAIDDGADFIEPDLVPTQDGFLIARHENNIIDTSNISTLPQFADRKKTKNIDGQNLTGWFTEDFTLNELTQNVKARERIPQYRPTNTQYNDQFNIPTLDQIIELVDNHYKKTGKIVGLYIETKHPTYFKNIQLPLENTLIHTLAKYKYTRDIAPIYLQSFEVQNLKEMQQQLAKNRSIKHVKIIQLLDDKNIKPADGFVQTYGEMATLRGLQNIATYADGVGPSKTYIFTNDTQIPTTFIKDAHQVGLKVHPYTFKPENNFVPLLFKCPNLTIEKCESGAIRELESFFQAGVDGVFTDDPYLGRIALNDYQKSKKMKNP